MGCDAQYSYIMLAKKKNPMHFYKAVKNTSSSSASSSNTIIIIPLLMKVSSKFFNTFLSRALDFHFTPGCQQFHPSIYVRSFISSLVFLGYHFNILLVRLLSDLLEMCPPHRHFNLLKKKKKHIKVNNEI